MDAFPAFVPLRGARVVVAGEGEGAEAKARLFEGSPADLVRIVDPVEAARPEAYRGAVLAFIALDGGTALLAAEAARSAGAWVNVVDRPAASDFYTPSIVDRGVVVGAVGTAGTAPLLAARLRAELEVRWPTGLGRLAVFLASLREPLRAALLSPQARRAALYRVLDGPSARAALAGDDAAAVLHAEAAIARETRDGRVVQLVAPAEPDLLTLRAAGVLARADRLVHPPQLDPAILAHARRDAPRATVASEAELARWAGEGETVVVISAPTDGAGRNHPE